MVLRAVGKKQSTADHPKFVWMGGPQGIVSFLFLLRKGEMSNKVLTLATGAIAISLAAFNFMLLYGAFG